ncbi:MAG: hypothetical protein P1U61_05875 [Legionellaceae bacterium]|nr:hypothetical protein [Legionellaceae bacterium]
MTAQLETNYRVALQKLKAKAADLNAGATSAIHQPHSLSVTLSNFIRSVEGIKSKEDTSLQRLTEALDSTCDLLEHKITLERYHQIADCMLSSSPEKGGTSFLGICMKHLSFTIMLLSFFTLFATGNIIVAGLGLVTSYFLDDLGKYIDADIPKKVPEPTPLAHNMRLFSTRCIEHQLLDLESTQTMQNR